MPSRLPHSMAGNLGCGGKVRLTLAVLAVSSLAANAAAPGHTPVAFSRSTRRAGLSPIVSAQRWRSCGMVNSEVPSIEAGPFSAGLIGWQ